MTGVSELNSKLRDIGFSNTKLPIQCMAQTMLITRKEDLMVPLAKEWLEEAKQRARNKDHANTYDRAIQAIEYFQTNGDDKEESDE